jgi:lipid A 3-O-deacylase
MKKVLSPHPRPFLLMIAALAAAASAGAEGLRPDGYYVQGGAATRHGYSASAGLTWAWSWQRPLGGSQVTGYTEAFVSEWSARTAGDRRNVTQLGVVPMFRMRFDGGSSPWFVEGGIGLSVTDRLYRTQTRQFSTRFNFTDVVAVGRSFGEGGRQDLSLRLNHISNAGIREPNPGENFLQLRYAARF